MTKVRWLMWGALAVASAVMIGVATEATAPRSAGPMPHAATADAEHRLVAAPPKSPK